MTVLFTFPFIHVMAFMSYSIVPELPLAFSYSTFLSLHGCLVYTFHQLELLVTRVRQPRIPGQVRDVVCVCVCVWFVSARTSQLSPSYVASHAAPVSVHSRGGCTTYPGGSHRWW